MYTITYRKDNKCSLFIAICNFKEHIDAEFSIFINMNSQFFIMHTWQLGSGDEHKTNYIFQGESMQGAMKNYFDLLQ